ncbi:aminotransferase class I/II-fold pyridoxal phosphate-dependent enzyme [Candidatus Desantisbacteria bacterium]|nr:aminotransferase class I/II-fold pyridoxal phosphate-dependent enzyme [Candidatus Desantisbacteria bacterium]
MALRTSNRIEQIVQSEIRAMSIECEKVKGINLAQGVCDTEVPLPVRAGAKNAIDEGINSYTRFDGIDELRIAISKKMKAYNGITADPETEIVVSSGSTGSFYCACLALLNPGDEVILFEPYYGYHVNTLLAAETVPVFVKLQPPQWSFDPKDLEKIISPRTKGILINTPANPSGKVFSRKELEFIADFAVRHDLFVFTDEIYEYFLYDGHKHISPASLPGMAERTITISGVSKTFSITGWRIGYSISDAKWAKMIGYINDLVYVCAPAPLQMGVAKGLLELKMEYYNELCLEYAVKRDKICSSLIKAGLSPYKPQGAYYVLADISNVPGKTSKEKAMFILSKTGVACVPDTAFFHKKIKPGLVRFCYAKKDHELDEACKRLEKLKSFI